MIDLKALREEAGQITLRRTDDAPGWYLLLRENEYDALTEAVEAAIAVTTQMPDLDETSIESWDLDELFERRAYRTALDRLNDALARFDFGEPA